MASCICWIATKYGKNMMVLSLMVFYIYMKRVMSIVNINFGFYRQVKRKMIREKWLRLLCNKIIPKKINILISLLEINSNLINGASIWLTFLNKTKKWLKNKWSDIIVWRNWKLRRKSREKRRNQQNLIFAYW